MNRWPEVAAAVALVATLATAVVAQGPGTLATSASASASPATPAATPAADGNSFAIRNVRVFDGQRVIEHANVVVRDGRIAAVGPDAAIPDGLATVDGCGKTLLPGLIDAHTAQFDAAITAAHRTDKLAVVHVSRQQDAMRAVNAGADGLVHIFVDANADAAFARATRRQNTFAVPTLSVLVGMAGADEGARLAGDARLPPQLSADQVGSLKARFGATSHPHYLEYALASVRSLHAAGVTILAGTDAGNPGTAHGASLHGELVLLVRAGLTPAQALTAATWAPARRFGLTDRGRIAIGQRADLLLVDGDPTRDITATRAIRAVWKNGYAIDRALADSAKPVAVGAPAPDGTLVSDFGGAGADPALLRGVAFTAGQPAGTFAFRIDSVELR